MGTSGWRTSLEGQGCACTGDGGEGLVSFHFLWWRADSFAGPCVEAVLFSGRFRDQRLRRRPWPQSSHTARSHPLCLEKCPLGIPRPDPTLALRQFPKMYGGATGLLWVGSVGSGGPRFWGVGEWAVSLDCLGSKVQEDCSLSDRPAWWPGGGPGRDAC